MYLGSAALFDCTNTYNDEFHKLKTSLDFGMAELEYYNKELGAAAVMEIANQGRAIIESQECPDFSGREF